jgi:hypothetical protein
VRIINSGRRHGIAHEDIWHVVNNARRFLEHGELVMALGPDRTGNLLEVGVADWATTDPVIVHADVLRPSFYRYL